MIRFLHFFKAALLSVFAKRTIGVRILLIQDEQVLLVKHSYQSGWYTIGGEVERKETPRFAIERELQEEVGVTLTTPPELFSVYYSFHEKHDNYVMFYIGQTHTRVPVTSPEIAESKWFPLSDLPQDTSPATRRRIEEYLGVRAVSESW
jgi:8-oxo-dGTP pyrophosphatase MutT (NUDIX family)